MWLFVLTATEIQNIQVADGDVCRNLPVPIYMIFPRLFTCPTLATSNFKIGKLLTMNYRQTMSIVICIPKQKLWFPARVK